MSVAVLAISVAAILVGVLVWWQRERARGYSAPRKGVVQPSTYRLLEKTRERLFKRSRDVRFTIFVQEGDLLTPAARLGWGAPSAKSHATFRVGEGMAGLAWEHSHAILLSKIGPFASINEARSRHQELFNLSKDDVVRLSESQLRATAMVAMALKEGSWAKGVLCIDSLDQTAIPGPEHKRFWLALSRLSADLARTICVPGEIAPRSKSLKEFEGAYLDEVLIGPPPQASLPLEAPVPIRM